MVKTGEFDTVSRFAEACHTSGFFATTLTSPPGSPVVGSRKRFNTSCDFTNTAFPVVPSCFHSCGYWIENPYPGSRYSLICPTTTGAVFFSHPGRSRIRRKQVRAKYFIEDSVMSCDRLLFIWELPYHTKISYPGDRPRRRGHASTPCTPAVLRRRIRARCRFACTGRTGPAPTINAIR